MPMPFPSAPSDYVMLTCAVVLVAILIVWMWKPRSQRYPQWRCGGCGKNFTVLDVQSPGYVIECPNCAKKENVR
jgi:hypothetical protein